MTLTAHALFSRSFRAIRPLQQFSIFVAILGGKLEEAILNLRVYLLTSLSLSLVVSFHSVALVLGLDPCCCNRDSFALSCSGSI